MDRESETAERKTTREALLHAPVSWWDDTPWADIVDYAKASLSAVELRQWMLRPDVLARQEQTP